MVTTTDRSTAVDDGNARQDAATVHRDAVVVNGCAPTRQTLDVAIDAFRRGGVTATNLTTMNNDNCLGGAGWLGRSLKAIRQMDRRDARVVVAHCVADIREMHDQQGTSIILGTQNADPIEDNLDVLETYYAAGVRIFQPTYQRRNRLGDGCGESSDAGLSIFGLDFVRACNELGILIDVSHVGMQSTFDVIRCSDHPVAITHSNFRTLNPVARNKTDDEVRAVAEIGGVIGVTAVSRYLSPSGREHGTDLDDFLDSLEFGAELVGIDHVSIGLDICEGMTPQIFEERRRVFLDRFPELRAGGDFSLESYYTRNLSSSADLPNVTDGLLDRGWPVIDINKVLGENFMRLLGAVVG